MAYGKLLRKVKDLPREKATENKVKQALNGLRPFETQEEQTMAHKTKKIHSLKEFQRNAPVMVREIKKTGRPLLLGTNGKPKFIVQDTESYQKMLDVIDRLEAIEGIRRGLQAVEE